MLKDLVIEFQYRENYGIHGWDGQGEVPQAWKNKGGEELVITDVPAGVDLEAIIDTIRLDFEWFDAGSEQYVIGYGLEECGVKTVFERSQEELDGEILVHAKRISYSDLMLEMDSYYGA